MAPVGLILVGIGAWLLYAAISNQAPIRTLTAIVQNPANAAAILKGRQVPLSAGGSSTSSGAVSGGGGAAVVSFARSKIGQPYVFGGSKDGGWDCSGLTMRAIEVGYGIKLAHSSSAQLIDPRGRSVSKADLQPGDLVWPNMPPLAGDHVQIYSGGGKIIEAPRPGKMVREVPMWGFFAARRFGS